MKYQWFYESYKKKLTEWLTPGVGTASPQVGKQGMQQSPHGEDCWPMEALGHSETPVATKLVGKQGITLQGSQTPQSPVSPFRVTISQSIVDQIKEVVKLLYRVAHSKPYIESIQTVSDFERDLQKKSLEGEYSASSLLMSYDFHIDSGSASLAEGGSASLAEGGLKLIEVNTNSSGYLVSELVDQVQAEQMQREQAQRGRTQGAQSQGEHTQTKMQVSTQATAENKNQATEALLLLKQSFEEEWELFSNKSTVPERVWIVDHQIKKQKMYIEFLMYQSLLSSWGWPCDLYETGDLKIDSGGSLVNSEGQKAQMIYNRSTDFYFENFSDMRKAFLNKKCCISPHPMEYLLLANKLRLCEWSSAEFLDKLSLSVEEKKQIQSVVPWTAPLDSLSMEELWKKRKLLFFKPFTGYGGKSVYRGKNISKKVFSRIVREGGVFQHLVPPANFVDPDGEKWKYDIRAYVYRDRVQKLTARVYQGQVTGFRTPLSGFASLIIK